MVYGSAKREMIDKLESQQNKLIRNLTNKKYNCHSAQLYLDLDQLKVTDLINLNRVFFIKKLKYHLQPTSLNPLFITQQDAGERYSQNWENKFSVNLNGTFKPGLFPISEICKTWNKLPPGLQNVTKLNDFKKQVKQFYLSNETRYDTNCVKDNCYPCRQS